MLRENLVSADKKNHRQGSGLSALGRQCVSALGRQCVSATMRISHNSYKMPAASADYRLYSQYRKIRRIRNHLKNLTAVTEFKVLDIDLLFGQNNYL